MRSTLPLFRGRAKWKGPHIVNFPINLSQALAQKVAIRTQARSCTILPEFVGLKFLVHNGMDYIPVNITDEMIGHKLGEFSPTRKRHIFSGNLSAKHGTAPQK